MIHLFIVFQIEVRDQLRLFFQVIIVLAPHVIVLKC